MICPHALPLQHWEFDAQSVPSGRQGTGVFVGVLVGVLVGVRVGTAQTPDLAPGAILQWPRQQL